MYCQFQLNFPRNLRMVSGIVQQDRHHLCDPVLIQLHNRDILLIQRQCKCDPLLFCQRILGFVDFQQQHIQLHRLLLQCPCSAVRTGKGQHVPDQAGHPVTLPMDHTRKLRPLNRFCPFHSGDCGEDRRKRCPQFMGGRRNKVSLTLLVFLYGTKHLPGKQP